MSAADNYNLLALKKLQQFDSDEDESRESVDATDYYTEDEAETIQKAV